MARVLVVDDNAVMRTVMRVALERAGHTVTMAGDGKTALGAIAGGGEFDLMVTDIQMPGMGGVELVRAIRQSSPAVRILVISGRVEGPEGAELASATKLGAHGSMEKPFTADRLVTKVAEMLA